MRGRCKTCDRLVTVNGRRRLVGPVLDYHPTRHDKPPQHVRCGGSVHVIERSERLGPDEVNATAALECDRCGQRIESYAEECAERGACDGHDRAI